MTKIWEAFVYDGEDRIGRLFFKNKKTLMSSIEQSYPGSKVDEGNGRVEVAIHGWTYLRAYAVDGPKLIDMPMLIPRRGVVY